ncbi:DUF6162 family protein [Ottowia sp. oral taxon 894]|uniref:DUF6162 family protein n=1 Tax=Ottowia sp. oral taxon 894 TaxID=1658672 RepID=UPI00068256DB|nr:DUF6162 family protein [Ottowia sp. oral taxon 894]
MSEAATQAPLPPSPPAAGAAALPAGCVQQVPPAGAGRETRWVLVTVALVLALSGTVAVWQRHMQTEMALQAHQIDLATGLTAAEQGIYTDLQAVHDEWRAEGRPLPPPAPDVWASDGWPPFEQDLAAQRRGARQWRVVQAEGRYAYLGEPNEAQSSGPGEQGGQAARLMLWRLPAAQDAEARFDVWLRTASGPARAAEALPGLHDDDLAAHGWRQVAAHLDDVKPKDKH